MNFRHFELGFTSIIYYNKRQPIKMSYSDTETLNDAQIMREVDEEANNKVALFYLALYDH